MWVVAKSSGFYNGSLVPVGAKLDMKELDEGHKPKPWKMPRWVVPVADYKPAMAKSDEQKAIDTAIAVAGPKRPGVKAVTNTDGTDLF